MSINLRAGMRFDSDATPILHLKMRAPRRSPRRGRRRLAAAAILTMVLLAASFLPGSGPLESFWGPMLGSPIPILLCAADLEAAGPGSPPPGPAGGFTIQEFANQPNQMMLLSDAVALSRVAGLLQAKGQQYRI